VVATDDRNVGTHNKEDRMRKKVAVYLNGRVQLTAFGLANPEQGALFSQAELERAEPPDNDDDWTDDYRRAGLDPLTLDPEA
jgi:hypothetical protein